MPSTSVECAECGAAQAAGVTCLDCFHALLAFENEHPPTFGAVHHLTVACYYLQHPTGYGPDTLEMWRTLLADTLSGRATVPDARRRASQRFEGSRRVRQPGATPPSWWPKAWPMTVGAVLRPDEPTTMDRYVDRAMEWARTTNATLSATAPEPPRR